MAKELDDEKIEEIKKAWFRWEELKKEGTVRPLKDVAQALGISVNTLKKYKPEEIELDDVKEMAEGKAEGKVISEVIKNISEDATVEHERTLVVGRHVREKYEDMAKAYGMNVEEFVDGAVTFWDVYRDKVKELEEDNKKMEAYIEKLVNMISKEQVAERVINNAVSTSIALDSEIKTEELRKVIKLIHEEM